MLSAEIRLSILNASLIISPNWDAQQRSNQPAHARNLSPSPNLKWILKNCVAEQKGFEPSAPGPVFSAKLSASLAQYFDGDGSSHTAEILFALLLVPLWRRPPSLRIESHTISSSTRQPLRIARFFTIKMIRLLGATQALAGVVMNLRYWVFGKGATGWEADWCLRTDQHRC
jgi:hypothetical protein